MIRKEGTWNIKIGFHRGIFILTSVFRGPGGYSQKNLVGVCGPLPKTLTLFMTKICDFPYPIYDLTKTLIPYL